MGQNVGKWDRIIRGVLAGVLLAFGLAYMRWWLIVIAGLLLLTAIIGFCTPYKLLKIDTRKKK